MNEIFRKFSHKTSELAGTPLVFTLAVMVVLIWAITGPVFHFSQTWQLFINTLTTILTFLMVFILQNTQNRDAKAMQLKLDELIKALGRARNALMEAEDLSDEELEEYREKFIKLAEKRQQAKTQRK